MKFCLLNNSRFKTKTLDTLIRFSLRGFGPYLKDNIIIEVSDYYYEEKKDDIEYDEDSLWGGVAFGDEKILVFINPKLKLPCVLEANWSYKTKYLSGQFIKNTKELLIFLISHEATHLIQFNLKDPVIASNIVPFDEESESDVVAMIKLNQWRRLEEKRALQRKSAKV